MYENTQIIDQIINDAENIVLNIDRKKFDIFLKVVEKIIIDNKVLLGGKIGIQALTGESLSKDSYLWHIYADNPTKMSKIITDKLYHSDSKDINKETIFLETNLIDKEFTIYIDNRIIFKIYGLGNFRDYKLYNLIGSINVNSFFHDKQMKIISGEMYLIDIYQKLYTPYAKKIGGYTTYSEYRILENAIYNKIIHQLLQKTLGIEGGNDKQTLYEITDENLHLVKQLLFDTIINKTDRIIIGDYALYLYAYSNQYKFSRKYEQLRMQILTSEDIEILQSLVQRILKNNSYNNTIKYVNYELNIPSDFRIKKYIIYVLNNQGDRIPLIDIFNSPQYELIPFKKVSFNNNEIKIGGLYVLLRFKFIDLWTLKLIYNIDNTKMKRKNIEYKIRNILSDIRFLKKITDEINDLSELFQTENYIGTYIDEFLAKKKIIKESGLKHKRYYPK